MCGYFGNLHECPAVVDLLNQLRIPLPYPQGRYYQRRWVAGLLTAQGEGFALSEALWWYALREEGQALVINDKVTSFNARNLNSPLWRNALRSRRAVVFATEIGESRGKQRYLMQAPGGLALGALYKDWRSPRGEVLRSMAVITRPPHPRFSQYHSQSIPCFLPLDADFIKTWLRADYRPGEAQQAEGKAIEQLLAQPKIYQTLQVTPVKTYKDAVALGPSEHLPADEDASG